MVDSNNQSGGDQPLMSMPGQLPQSGAVDGVSNNQAWQLHLKHLRQWLPLVQVLVNPSLVEGVGSVGICMSCRQNCSKTSVLR